MKLRAPVAVVAGALLMSMASSTPASAKVQICKVGEYGLATGGFPVISRLRAIDLPKKTSGYAPACLVAEGAAGVIQERFSNDGKLPKTIVVQGARWNAGHWGCSYKTVSQTTSDGSYIEYKTAICVSRTKATRKITMELGS